MIIITLCLIASIAIANPDYGRTATLTPLRQGSHDDLNGKNFDLTATSASSQTLSAKHQLIRIVLADPLHSCSVLSPIKEEKTQTTNITIPYPVYFLAQGRDGGCTYSQKVKWAKQAGARGMIIIDSKNSINNLRPRKDDKFQTFLMPEDQGDKFVAAMKDEKTLIARLNIGDTGDRKQIIKVKTQIWISSLNRDSYNVMEWFQQALTAVPSMKEHLDWRPRFAIVSSSWGGNQGSQFVSSCACDGSFCSPQQHGRSSNILVREDIRQILVFKDHQELFLPYMRAFKERCLQKYIQTSYTEECSNRMLTRLGIDSQNIDSRIHSFLQNCIQSGQPTQLYKQLTLDRAKMLHINHYPTMIVNHEQITFKNEVELKSTLCRKLNLQKEKGCGQTITNQDISSTVVAGIFWLIALVLLMGVGALVVVYFRNKLRKDVNKQLKMQVSTAVEHYYQLSQSSDTK